MSDSPNAKIPLVPQNTTDPAAGLNLAIDVIDVLVQTAVISMSLTAPPGSPQDGDLYIPAGPATGAWAGLEDYVVRYVTEGTFWKSYAPGDPINLVLNRADGNLYRYDTTSPGGWSIAAGLGDAPSDGNTYGRKDGAWEQISGVTRPPVVTYSGTALDALPADEGEYTRFTNAGAKTYTFDDADGFTAGEEYHGRNVGAGDLTITEAGGMTINPPAGGSLVVPQGGTFTIKIVATDEADLFGVTNP